MHFGEILSPFIVQYLPSTCYFTHCKNITGYDINSTFNKNTLKKTLLFFKCLCRVTAIHRVSAQRLLCDKQQTINPKTLWHGPAECGHSDFSH